MQRCVDYLVRHQLLRSSMTELFARQRSIDLTNSSLRDLTGYDTSRRKRGSQVDLMAQSTETLHVSSGDSHSSLAAPDTPADVMPSTGKTFARTQEFDSASEEEANNKLEDLDDDSQSSVASNDEKQRLREARGSLAVVQVCLERCSSAF